MNINFKDYVSCSSIYSYFYKEDNENKEDKQNSFFTDMGKLFERKVVEYISNNFGDKFVEICKSDRVYGVKDIHILSQLTASHIANKTPIIYSAPIFDTVDKVYGIADLLVRKDYIKYLFPKSTLFVETQSSSTEYIVIDIKWKKLDIIKNTFLSNSASYKAYKSQVYLYSKGVSNMTGTFLQDYGIILGKGCKYTKNKTVHISNNPFEIPGVFNIKDEAVVSYTDEALAWVKSNQMGNKNKNKIIGGKRKRGNEEARAELSKSILQFSFNKMSLQDTYVKYNNPCYLDFEFLTPGIFDDFSDITNIKSEDYVFMIGVGYEESSEWKYECFMCDKLEKQTEKYCFEQFIKLVREKNFDCVYYYDVEKSIFAKKVVELGLNNDNDNKYNYNSFISNLNWVNVKEILVKNNFIFKDCDNYKLKSIAKALEECKKIDLSEDNKIDLSEIDLGITSDTKDGITCMFEMYKMYKSVYNEKLVQDMLSYNNLDCKYLNDIIKFIEKNKNL